MAEANDDDIPPGDTWIGLTEHHNRVTRALGNPETAKRRIRSRLEDQLLRFRFIDEADPALLFTTDPKVLFRYRLPYGYTWKRAEINFATAQASWDARVEATPPSAGVRITDTTMSIRAASHRFPPLQIYKLEVLVPSKTTAADVAVSAVPTTSELPLTMVAPNELDLAKNWVVDTYDANIDAFRNMPITTVAKKLAEGSGSKWSWTYIKKLLTGKHSNIPKRT